MFKAFLVWSLFSFTAFAAEESSLRNTEGSSETSVGEYVLYGTTSMFATTYLHEVAHAYTAKYYGASNVKVYVNILGLGGRTEYTDPEEKISNHEHQVIALSGPVANRLLAGITNQVLNLTDAQGVPAKWGAMFYFTNRLGLVSQWLLGIIRWTDFSDQAKLVSPDYNQRAKIMGLWGALLSLDLYLCWDDITHNHERLKTGQAKYKSTSRIFLTPDPRAPMIGYQMNW